MIIFEDTRQKLDKNAHIREYLEQQGHKVVRTKLPVGDYANIENMKVIVDTKYGLQEVAGNLCQSHERFRRECELAQELGIKLTILIQEPTIKTLEDVKAWNNPRLKHSPKAATGERLYKIMNTMSERYDVAWKFTTKQKCGEKIIELLCE